MPSLTIAFVTLHCSYGFILVSWGRTLSLGVNTRRQGSLKFMLKVGYHRTQKENLCSAKKNVRKGKKLTERLAYGFSFSQWRGRQHHFLRVRGWESLEWEFEVWNSEELEKWPFLGASVEWLGRTESSAQMGNQNQSSWLCDFLTQW